MTVAPSNDAILQALTTARLWRKMAAGRPEDDSKVAEEAEDLGHDLWTPESTQEFLAALGVVFLGVTQLTDQLQPGAVDDYLAGRLAQFEAKSADASD